MLQYERLSFTDKRIPIILQVTAETDRFLHGVEVDREGEYVVKRVNGQRVDITRHVIEKTVITKRVPLVMNLHYGELEPVTKGGQ